MTRAQIISAIQANKERAIGLGFDWPTVDINVTDSETLVAFLAEVEEFLEAS